MPIADFVLISISQSLEADCALMLPRQCHPHNNYNVVNKFAVLGDQARLSPNSAFRRSMRASSRISHKTIATHPTLA
jgi:hypothetical protein